MWATYLAPQREQYFRPQSQVHPSRVHKRKLVPNRFEKVLGRHGIDIPRQTLARWVIQCGEHLQPLLNLMRDPLLESRVIHCDKTRVQVNKEPGREPTSQSWMWVQTGGPPNQPVVLFDYSTSCAQDLPSRLLESYRGYLMTDYYAGYNALGAQPGIQRLGCWAHARRKFVEAQKVQPNLGRYRTILNDRFWPLASLRDRQKNGHKRSSEKER